LLTHGKVAAVLLVPHGKVQLIPVRVWATLTC